MKFSEFFVSLFLHIILLEAILIFKPPQVIPPLDMPLQLNLAIGELPQSLQQQAPAKPSESLIEQKHDQEHQLQTQKVEEKILEIPNKDAKIDSKQMKRDNADILSKALSNAKKAVDQREKRQKDTALSRALSAAKHESNKYGSMGSTAGGLNDLYAGQIIEWVRQNWSIPTYSREMLTVSVRVKIDESGRVLDATIENPSPRPDFDASAINAILRTQKLPPPPTSEQQNIVIRFNSLELSRS